MVTRGTVLLALRHLRFLASRRRVAKEHFISVRNDLRRLGIHALADELSLGLRALGEISEVVRAAEAAAEGGGTVDAELRRQQVRRRGREVA